MNSYTPRIYPIWASGANCSAGLMLRTAICDCPHALELHTPVDIIAQLAILIDAATQNTRLVRTHVMVTAHPDHRLQ